MAIAFVAERGKLAGTASTGGELGVALTASKAGNALVACVSAPSGTLTISDALGNTWTRVQTVTNGTVQAAIFVAVLTKGSPTEAKVAGLGNKGKAEVAVFEFSGVNAATATRTSGTATGSGTAVKAGPTTEATVAEDAYVAAFASSATSATLTAGGGATVLASVGQTGGTVGAEWHSGLGAAAQTAEGTFSVTGTWAGVVVVLRPEVPKGSAQVTGGGGVTARGHPPLPVGGLTPYSPRDVSSSLGEPQSVAISPDEKHVYVGSSSGKFIGCYERLGSGLLKALSPELLETEEQPIRLAVSPDGKHVYVACRGGGGVVLAFSRNESTGILTGVGSKGVLEPRGVAVSPDGKNVYVVSTGGATVSQFTRNISTGVLTALSPATVTAGPQPWEIAVSPGGNNVYVTSLSGKALLQYSRNAETGALTAMSTASLAVPIEATSIVVSADGKSLYAVSEIAIEGGVYQFDRAESGELTAKSPASTGGSFTLRGVNVSPDGRSVYATNSSTGRIQQYSRATNGNLTALSTASVVSAATPVGLVVSPDGESVYVACKAQFVSQYSREPAVPGGSASVSGGGAVTARGNRVPAGSGTVTGAGTVGVRATGVRVRTAAITGGGTVTVIAHSVVKGSALVTAGGTVVTTGHRVEPQLASGAAHVTGAGAVQATIRRLRNVTAPVTGAGTVVVAVRRSARANAAVSGAGGVTVAVRRVARASPAVTSGGTVSAAGHQVIPGSVYDQAVLADAPVGFWPLNEASGSIVHDRSGANSGTYVGGVTLNQPGIGDGESAPVFDGTSGYVQIPNTAALNFAATGVALSLEAWMKIPAYGSYSQLITKGVGNFPAPYEWRLDNAAPAQFAQTFALSNVYDAAAPPLGEWVHMVATIDASGNIAYYRNGVRTATGKGSLEGPATSQDIKIGTRDNLDRFWNGQLAKCAVYNYVLTPTQVAAHYAASGAAPLVSGSANVSGGGAVKALGGRLARSSATVSGAGAITATGHKVEPGAASGSAHVTGAGTTGATVRRSALTGVHVSGAGATAVAVRRAALVGAHVSSAGAVTVRGLLSVGGVVRVTGGGAVTASTARLARGTASITAGGTVGATGQKIEPGKVSGSALVHGAGAVSSRSAAIRKGTVSVTGAGSVTIRASHLVSASVLITTGGMTQTVGRKAARVTAGVSGGGLVVVSSARTSRVSVNVAGGGQVRALGAIALLRSGVSVVHGGGKVFGFGHFAVGLPLEPGGASSSRATGLSPEPRIIDPSVCWVRHVIRGAAGQPGAQPVAHVYFAREDVLTGNDGLNGRAGWQLAQTTAQLSNDGSFSIALPNGPGEDGILHRRRFRILTDENYEPGEEWLEFYRDPNDLVFVGTPTDYEKTPSTITIKGIDLPEILGGSMSSEVDVWDGHAPVDVMRHYCRLAVLCDGVDLTGALINSVAGEWSKAPYQRAGIKGVEADCWTAEARIRQTSPRATAAGQYYVALNLWGPSGLIAQLRVDLWEGLVYISSHWLEGGIEDQRLGLVMPGEVDLRVVARYDRLFFFVAGELVTEMRRWGIGEGKPFDAVESLEVSCYGLVELAVDGIHVESLAPFASRGASVPAVRTLPGLPPPTGLRARYYNAAPMYAATNKLNDIKARVWPVGLEPTVDRVEPQLNAGNVGNMPNLPGAVAARWTGAIYLDLASSDRRIAVHQSAYTRVYVGRTLRKEPYMSSWGESVVLPWFEGPDIGPSLRTHLGTSEAGWYPIVIEQIKAGPGNSLILEDGPAGGPYAPVPRSRLSPIGVYADTIRLTPHRKAFGDIATTFGYQWRVEHRSLETGEFPGQISFGPLLGRQTNVTIDDEAVGTQAQVQGAALDCVDGLLIDAAGLADPKGSGQLTAQTVNYERALGHMALRQVYESLSEVSEEPLVEQRADSLLALRSSPNEQVGVRPSGQRDVVDLLPLTGAKAKLDWQPGDGVVLRLQNLDVRDESPRQLTGVTWNLHPDGTGAPTVTWRNRPRDIRTALRKLTSSILGPRRTYQGQVSIVTGTFGGWNVPENTPRAGCVDQYSRLALPVPWEQIIGVWLNVFELSGTGWRLDIAGTTIGEPLTVTGRYEVTQQVKPWNLPQNGTYALLLGASAGYYCCQLEARVIL